MAPTANFVHATRSSRGQRQADEEWGRSYMAKKEAARNDREDRGFGGLLTEDTLASLNRALPKELPGNDSIQRSFPHHLTREMASAASTQSRFVPADGAMIERALNASLLEKYGPEPTKEQIARGYQVAMKSIHGYEPSLADIVGLAVDECLEFDSSKKACSRRLLDRFCCRYQGPVERTMVGSSGAKGGFSLALSMWDTVADRARATDGPFARAKWQPVRTRMWRLPIYPETSRARGSRYGGVVSSWGLPEVVLAPASDGAIQSIEMTQNRLTVLSLISADLFRDAPMASEMISYMHTSEMRAAIESVMIGVPGSEGLPPGASMQGAINANCTVTIAKDNNQTGGTITASNINNMWAALASACEKTAVWHCNKNVMAAIDTLAVSGEGPKLDYLPQGRGGNEFPLLKGRPVISSEFTPALGQPGDLILCDWNSYVISYLQPDPMRSPLSFYVTHPDDDWHQGVRGLPDGSVEFRMSPHQYFTTDVIAFCSKMRLSGHFTWGQTGADYTGNVIGPCVITALRA